jgi:hypothetical protein
MRASSNSREVSLFHPLPYPVGTLPRDFLGNYFLLQLAEQQANPRKGQTEEALKRNLPESRSYRAALLTRTDFKMAKARAKDGIVITIRMNPSSAYDNGP